jgi:hypothetical protein
MVGGDLHWIWEPYGIYQDIDWVRRIFSDQKLLLTLAICFGCAGTDLWRQGIARQ